MGAFRDSLKNIKEVANKSIDCSISNVEKSYNNRLNDVEKIVNEIKREFENDCEDENFHDFSIEKSKRESNKIHGQDFFLTIKKGEKTCVRIMIEVFYSKAEFDVYKEKEKISSSTNINDCCDMVKQIINDVICSKNNEADV
ncbi:hypothetical protein [Fibrobacter sp. UWP2]|uniref:hypothetical protein n=1 Tax=Fibrobacter sp. UWP2 TaxID=1896216 RepID=UPI000910241C|nr:hypothetical protein [Fibrobacter sp. UWP2]SHI82016.1 hypothetical protein SAMN05720471_10886 [Fibrobacter sp. UWP2]